MSERRAILRAQFLGALSAAGLVTGATNRPVDAATASATLDLQETDWEVRPGLVERITTAGGTYPGTPIRVPQDTTVDIAVRNRTSAVVAIHWHGLVASPAVDGVPELGTPVVKPGETRTYPVSATVGGTRWYHAHAGADLLFGGLAGSFIVDRKSEPSRYDLEVVLLLHEFARSTPLSGSARDERPAGAPSLSKPSGDMGEMVMNGVRPASMLMHDARYGAYAVNGKALGAGDPIRVRTGDVVLFRIINASATVTHRLALPGHRFMVSALDGNPVPQPTLLDAVELGPGERVDALVQMIAPGIYIFGSTQKRARENGMGIVIAYDGASGRPTWHDGDGGPFLYAYFGGHGREVAHLPRIDLVLRKSTRNQDAWSINHELFPDTRSVRVRAGSSYVIRFQNASMMEHPMHLHGHSFELVSVDGLPIAGIMKDTVVVRPGGTIDVLLRADNPYRGRYLLHCHNEQHAHGGMATILAYDR
jgi:FtsP/CotA-like multicopper oxidase with cupredoxin domain